MHYFVLCNVDDRWDDLNDEYIHDKEIIVVLSHATCKVLPRNEFTTPRMEKYAKTRKKGSPLRWIFDIREFINWLVKEKGFKKVKYKE